MEKESVLGQNVSAGATLTIVTMDQRTRALLITAVIVVVVSIIAGIFIGRETVPVVVCPKLDTSEQDSLKAVVAASKQREADLWLLYEESQVTIYKLDSAFKSKSPTTQSNDAYRRLYGLPADSLADGMRAVPIPPTIEGE